MTATLLVLATVLGAEPGPAWKQTDHALGLAQDGRLLWQYHYAPAEGKPYFHPLRIGGDVVTDLRPADHPWHRALWFSWKFLDGVNYWEEDPKTGQAAGVTELVETRAVTGPDHGARFEQTLRYHPPGKPAVLTEKRTVTVGPPAKDGGYAIDWHAVFTAGDHDVTLDRTPIAGEPKGVDYGGYAGLSLRLAPALRSWEFTGPDGPVPGRQARAAWMAFHGPRGVVAVLEHPSSYRHPTPWYLIRDMPYFSPAVLYRAPATLAAGQSLNLRCRILVGPGPLDVERLKKEWTRWAGKMGNGS